MNPVGHPDISQAAAEIKIYQSEVKYNSRNLSPTIFKHLQF
jgi:hypothetical protein